jgi:hypothetical protein
MPALLLIVARTEMGAYAVCITCAKKSLACFCAKKLYWKVIRRAAIICKQVNSEVHTGNQFTHCPIILLGPCKLRTIFLSIWTCNCDDIIYNF